MEKVFGVVILYNPTDEVIRNIASYSKYLSTLYVFDNSESICELDLEPLGTNIVYIADGVNKGISERLNVAAARAMALGAEWLLTMDQDSFFEVPMMEAYLSCVHSFGKRQQVAMFGVEYERQTGSPDCAAEETTFLITSGSCVNLSLFKKIGGFDEQLFIDEVDAEYCLRANMKGYKTVKFNHIFLNHSLGTVTLHTSLKHFRKTPRTLHAPLRVYYMVRNYLYIKKKYKKDLPGSFPYRRAALLNRIKNNLLYGKRRGLLLQYVIRAIRDFQSRKMGKYS